ncbi:MAG: trkD, partial [Rhodopila sp.]|nr:trkD [Rhodopila sp.]
TLLAAPPLRLPGTAAVFTAATTGVPLALTHHLKHNRVLHERVLLISGLTTNAPVVDPADRVKLIDMGGGLSRIVLFFGFMETPNIAEGLRLACTQAQFHDVDMDQLTYYFRRETVISAGKLTGMAAWASRSSPRCISMRIAMPPITGFRPRRSSRSASRSKSKPEQRDPRPTHAQTARDRNSGAPALPRSTSTPSRPLCESRHLPSTACGRRRCFAITPQNR